QASDRAHVSPPAGGTGVRRLGTRLELAEVAVVAGGLERGGECRVDEPAGCRGRCERTLDHLTEGLGHAHGLPTRAVDTAQLAVLAEAAELTVARPEDALDRLGLPRGGAADLDDAAHRGEATDGHEVCVEVDGFPCEGASAPPSSSKKPEP